MITQEMIIAELNKRGYEAEATSVTKNRVNLAGITITGGAIRPVVYTDDIIKEANETGRALEEVATAIMDTLEAHKAPAINADEVMSYDYIKDHIYIGIQRAGSNEGIIKAHCPEYDGIDKYLYIKGDPDGETMWSIKLKPEHLQNIGFDLADAWDLAELNTYKDTTIKSMFEALLGLGADAEEPAGGPALYIVSNKDNNRGAAGILNKELLKDFGKKHHAAQIAVIPSSIHECIIMPYDERFGLDELTQMILEVNASEVAPVDQLGDHPYIIDVA